MQLGYLIDFELEQDRANFLPRVRRVNHIGFPWLYDKQKLFIWHQYIGIFSSHFQDVGDVSSFYYDNLLEVSNKWSKQSSYRLIVESFVKILNYEGRAHEVDRCMVCSKEINDENISIIKGFLPTHTYCSNSTVINKNIFNALLHKETTINLNDDLVKELSSMVLKGLVI